MNQKICNGTESIAIVCNDFNESSFDITVTGTIATAQIAVSNDGTPLENGVSVLDLGSAFVGDTGATVDLVIRNAGDADLIINSIIVPGGFVQVGNVASPIASGSESTLQVQVNTSAAGMPSGNLSIASNDPNAPDFTVELHAIVYEVPTIEAIATFVLGVPGDEVGAVDYNQDGVVDSADIVFAGG